MVKAFTERLSVAIQSTREVLFYARGGQSVYKRIVSSFSLYLRCCFFNIAIAITVAVVIAFHALIQALKASNLILNLNNELFEMDKAPMVIKINGVDYLRSKCLNVHPGLAKMAFGVFAILVMNDDSERAFSASNDIVTKKRNSLNSDTVEAYQCLRSWY